MAKKAAQGLGEFLLRKMDSGRFWISMNMTVSPSLAIKFLQLLETEKDQAPVDSDIEEENEDENIPDMPAIGQGSSQVESESVESSAAI